MKLKLDAIQSKYMPLTMQGQQVVQPVLKIVAGDFEATTSRYWSTLSAAITSTLTKFLYFCCA